MCSLPPLAERSAGFRKTDAYKKVSARQREIVDLFSGFRTGIQKALIGAAVAVFVRGSAPGHAATKLKKVAVTKKLWVRLSFLRVHRVACFGLPASTNWRVWTVNGPLCQRAMRSSATLYGGIEVGSFNVEADALGSHAGDCILVWKNTHRSSDYDALKKQDRLILWHSNASVASRISRQITGMHAERSSA